MGKVNAGPSFSNYKHINCRVRWDMSNYPYASIDSPAEGLPNEIESCAFEDLKYVEELLGWNAKIPAPARTAEQIHDWIEPVYDKSAVSLSQLEKVLLHHPVYVVLEHKDRCSPMGFISRKTLIESACRCLLTWCSQAEPRELITETLGERICRLIASPYQLEPDELWTLLEQVGVIEKSGVDNISAAYMRTFLSFCQYWGLQTEFVLFWDGFEVRAQCEMSKPVQLDGAHNDYWLSQFDDDERTLFERRILDGHTLEELGLSLRITKERVRQKVKKAVDRLQHPTHRKSFGYALGQNLFDLPSIRLVHPDTIAEKMEGYFGRRITRRGLCQILRTMAMVTPIQVYDSDWLWVNWAEDSANLPGLETWEDEYNIDKEGYLSAARKCLGDFSKTEGDILFDRAEESHRSPRRLPSCIIRTLNTLKCPAHFKDIAATAQRLFLDFPGGLSATRVNYVLQNLERTGRIKKVDQAVYALPEYAEEKISRPLPEPPPKESTKTLLGGSILDYDAILAGIDRRGDCYRNIFIGLDPKDPDAIREAILRIIKAVGNLPKPCSLCELRINHEGYQWLILWAKHIDASTLRAILDNYDEPIEWGEGEVAPIALGTGLLLLLFAVEVGRREAVSSMLWPFVRRRFSDDARRVIFQGEQSINQRFKDIIESTCRKFNLRHVLGHEGTQSYYITMTLQYGFALSHLKQLPLTLTGHKNLRSIDFLLGTHPTSESFHCLFHTLRDFRFNHISRDIAAKILDVNPWVLPEKTEDVLDAAMSVENLEDKLSTTDNVEVAAEDDEQHILLIDKPRLRWVGVAVPFFECSLKQLDLIDIIDDRYDLFVGERYEGSLYRDNNGNYGGIEEIRIHLDSPLQIIRLCDSEGKTCYTQDLQLWNDEDDLMVSIFRYPSGSKIDAWNGQMDTQSQYVLITLKDLEVEPSIEPWRLVGEGKWRLILLEKGWTPDLKITFEGEDFWSPMFEPSDQSKSSHLDWERKIQINAVPNTQLEFGDRFDLIIKSTIPDVEISHAIFCKKPLTVTTLTGEKRIENIELTPEIAFAVWQGSKIELHLVHNGEIKRLRLPVDLDFIGSAIYRKTHWEPMSVLRGVTIQELESNRVQVFVPNPWRGGHFNDLALMEGTVFLRRLWKRPRTLGGLVGLGAPLKVQKPYNCLPGEKLLTLSTAVIDRGTIDRVLMDGTCVEIFLHRDVDPGPDHLLIGLSHSGLASQFKIRAYDGRKWLAEVSHPLIACGIAYRGECIGSWWEDSIDISGFLDTEDVQNVAAMMRWLHFPILKLTWKEKIIRFLETELVAVLSAWMQDQGLVKGLCFNETFDTWLATIGELFSQVQVDPKQASELVGLMIRDGFCVNFGEVLQCLGNINPIFMGNVLQGLVVSNYGNFSESEWIDHLKSVKRRFLLLPSRASERDVRVEEERYLNEAAQSMMLDPFFVKNTAQNGAKLVKVGHKQPLTTIERENLEIIMNVQPFNRYLCINILNDIVLNL